MAKLFWKILEWNKDGLQCTVFCENIGVFLPYFGNRSEENLDRKWKYVYLDSKSFANKINAKDSIAKLSGSKSFSSDLEFSRKAWKTINVNGLHSDPLPRTFFFYIKSIGFCYSLKAFCQIVFYPVSSYQ